MNPTEERPYEVAEGIYWVGFEDTESGLHCNPYLIVDGDEAVVIDGGSRPDFPSVMMKILKTGIAPEQIKTLIYQHYDPDLCGSIPHFENLIGSDQVELLSHHENMMFIRHYDSRSRRVPIEAIDNCWSFSSGRRLTFHNTPYAHSAGSFMTFDEQTGTLFSSDLLGSCDSEWSLEMELPEECRICRNYSHCPQGKERCPMEFTLRFHQRLMTSTRALHHALDVIESLPVSIIAPQHGSIIRKKEDIQTVLQALRRLDRVGIDHILDGGTP